MSTLPLKPGFTTTKDSLLFNTLWQNSCFHSTGTKPRVVGGQPQPRSVWGNCGSMWFTSHLLTSRLVQINQPIPVYTWHCNTSSVFLIFICHLFFVCAKIKFLCSIIYCQIQKTVNTGNISWMLLCWEEPDQTWDN